MKRKTVMRRPIFQSLSGRTVFDGNSIDFLPTSQSDNLGGESVIAEVSVISESMDAALIVGALSNADDAIAVVAVVEDATLLIETELTSNDEASDAPTDLSTIVRVEKIGVNESYGSIEGIYDEVVAMPYENSSEELGDIVELFEGSEESLETIRIDSVENSDLMERLREIYESFAPPTDDDVSFVFATGFIDVEQEPAPVFIVCEFDELVGSPTNHEIVEIEIGENNGLNDDLDVEAQPITDGLTPDIVDVEDEALPVWISCPVEEFIEFNRNPDSSDFFEENAGVGGNMNDLSSHLMSSTSLNVDVNSDNLVTPLDALLVINSIRRQSILASTSTELEGESVSAFDVNQDGKIAPLDALIVINHLSRASTSRPAALIARETQAGTSGTMSQAAVIDFSDDDDAVWDWSESVDAVLNEWES